MHCKRQRSPVERRLLMAEVDRLKGTGKSVDQICRSLGLPQSTYYGWKLGKGEARSETPKVMISTQYNPRTESILVGAGL